MRLDFTIPYRLRQKQGDRSRVALTGEGKQHVRHYQPKKVVDAANNLAALVAGHRPSVPLQGPLHLRITVVCPWRANEAQWRKASGVWPKDTKPDCDNLSKQMCDVLAGAGFYGNDSQIAHLEVIKAWGNSPDIRIELETIELPKRS